jgi:CheY-like chemotaxis protein
MPLCDGYTATKLIREYEVVHKISRVTIVAVTAHAMTSDKDKCLESGMDNYLVKPINNSALDQILEAHTCKKS